MHSVRWLGLTCAIIAAGEAQLSAQSHSRTESDAAAVAEARSLLKALVETNTTHDRGSTTAAARLLADRFLQAGWPVADVEIAGPSPTRQNLVVRWRASAPVAKPVMFMSHLDVVEAKREDWDSDPFVLREQDGYLYGRGVLDDKAAVATWTAGMIALRHAGWRPSRDIVLLLTAAEEGGDENGVDWLLHNRRALFDADFVLNADAAGPELHDGKVTLFAVDVAEKTPMTIDLAVSNPGGHSSRPRLDNAIYSLAHALVRLEQYRFPVQLGDLQRAMLTSAAGAASTDVAAALRAILRDPGDSAAAAALERVPHLNAMLRTTCVATMLAGGHAYNALPQRATATVNCRILPGVQPDTVIAQIRRAVADSAVHFGTPVLSKPAAPATPVRADVMQLLSRAVASSWGTDVRVQPMLSLGATDGSFIRLAGVPTYTIWHVPLDPADMRAHGRDERILAKSFDESVGFARNLIRAAAGDAHASGAIP
jgi:acetylornithine deacetylase/succinyl-diaminopimelate desuccinylase-like protein